MYTTVINIGVTDEAEALLNEELKKIEGYTGHVVTNNGFNSQLIVFGSTEEEEPEDEEDLEDEEEEGEDDPEPEPEPEPVIITPQAKLLYVPLDQTEAQKVIDEALKDLTLVAANPITAIDSNRLLIIYNSTPEEPEDPEDDDEDGEDDPQGGGGSGDPEGSGGSGGPENET